MRFLARPKLPSAGITDLAAHRANARSPLGGPDQITRAAARRRHAEPAAMSAAFAILIWSFSCSEKRALRS